MDAAGAWTARVAAAAGIALPLVPVRHQLFITEPIAGVEPLQPIVRLLEASVYVRHEQGGLLFGGYEDRPRVIDPDGAGRRASTSPQLELDLGVLRALVDEVVEHFPVLRARASRGAPRRRADDDARRPARSSARVPGLDGLYVASGCCVGGLSLSPAAGRALADLIVDGKSDPDLGAALGRALPRALGRPRPRSRPRASASTRGATRRPGFSARHHREEDAMATVDWSYHRNG